MIVQEIPVGARLIDSVGLRPEHIANLGNVDGIIAYLGGDLTPELVAAALEAKKGVVPVNYSRSEGWSPSAALGHADAATSLKQLDALCLPVVGLVDWCDLEGCGDDPTTYLDAWSEDVTATQRIGGLYVGAGGLLTGVQLYQLPHFSRYWHSLSRGIPEPSCGYVLGQLYPTVIAGGLELDFDFAQKDFLGRAASWVVAG